MNFDNLLAFLYSLLVVEGIILSVFGSLMVLIVSWNYSKAKMKKDNKEPHKVREQESKPTNDKLYRKVDEEMATHPHFKVRRLHKLYSANQVRELAITNCISDASSKKKMPLMEELVKVNEDEGYRDLLIQETSLTRLRQIAKRLDIDSKQDKASLAMSIKNRNQEAFDEIFKGLIDETESDHFTLDSKEAELLGKEPDESTESL